MHLLILKNKNLEVLFDIKICTKKNKFDNSKNEFLISKYMYLNLKISFNRIYSIQ